jgi:AcrR family transcriptional regulator
MREARSYRLQRRAERQEETRRRILEATVSLHAELGAARTSIAAIAERAGVERLTVYRHFPDERALLTGCTGHYQAAHPPPDPTPWRAMADPRERLRTGLAAVYAYHRATERMMSGAQRDLAVLPVLREVLAPVFAHWRRVQAVLAEGWPDPAGLVGPLLGHAIGFGTWQSLVREQGLTEAEAVALMARLVEFAAAGERAGADALDPQGEPAA